MKKEEKGGGRGLREGEKEKEQEGQFLMYYINFLSWDPSCL